MNKFNTNLTIGQVVVTKDGQLWQITGGFGIHTLPLGYALYATCVDGTEDDIRDDIDRIATPEETEHFKVNAPIKTMARLESDVERQRAELARAEKRLASYKASIQSR